MPTYVFSETASDASYERQIALGRLHMAIMLEAEPIGEIILKNIDWENHHCTLGIHLNNDSLKNCGYGTQAEILLLQYAFDRLGMETVYADAILKKRTKSTHIAEGRIHRNRKRRYISVLQMRQIHMVYTRIR